MILKYHNIETYRKVIEKFFLNDEIPKNLKLIKNIKFSYKQNLVDIDLWISLLDNLRYLRHLSYIDKKEKLKKLNKDDKSLKFLIKKKFGVNNDNIGNIINLSTKALNTNEINVLKLDFKFSIPKKTHKS